MKWIRFITGCLVAQACVSTADKAQFREDVSSLYTLEHKPFYHGIASGDPLTDRVILWTRVTPEDSGKTVDVHWEISKDNTFAQIIQAGETTTSAARDYTVKVDVGGLEPDTYYYYRFQALEKMSLVGRTKTLPVDVKDSIRFAIVSCSNWEFGYFNAYDRIAEKSLDAVVHLGDYIYEYAVGVYGDTTIGRTHLPPHELITLNDYRIRYSQYHLDEGLQNARRQHPFITIWDDHEFANNVYAEGAQNHQPGEGDFSARKHAARQAYYEWLPIRESEKHYRAFSFGPLADLIMLDERVEGRSAPVESISAPEYASETRSMLGADQHHWLEERLRNSTSTWKIIGNQVVFSSLNIEGLYGTAMPKNLDAWDGYPAEQKKISSFFIENKINNIIFVSGDTHAAWAIEVPNNTGSNPQQKSIAIELGTTSLSSGNGNEGNTDSLVISKEQVLMNLNPHVKYMNNRDHGYLLLTLHPKTATAEWFTIKTLRKRDSHELRNKKYSIQSGEFMLKEVP